MASNKRIVLTKEETVKRLNLMAAVLCEDATDLANEAVNLLWEKKGKGVLEQVSLMSPVADHLPTVVEGETEEAELTPEQE